MTLECIVRKQMPAVDADSTLATAISYLRSQSPGFAYVTSRKRPVGVLNLDAALRRALLMGSGWRNERVTEAMDHKVPSFSSDSDSGDVAATMVEKGLTHAIVKDHDDAVIGYVSLEDVMRPRHAALATGELPGGRFNFF